MQHGASVTKGWPAGALRCDLAGLPLLRRLSSVCTGALFRGRAATGSLSQAAILPTQTGHGLYCEMEGQCCPSPGAMTNSTIVITDFSGFLHFVLIIF